MAVTEHEVAWAEAMRAANRGDAEAYRRLLGAVAAALRRPVAADLAGLGAGTDETDDVVQEVLLAIHLKRHTWDEGRPIVPWVRAVARYKTLDHVRRQGRRPGARQAEPAEELVDRLPAPEPGPTPVLLERLLAGLPPRQRDVVRALSLEALTGREAAAKLGMSEGAVRVAFHRGLAALAALARRARGEPGEGGEPRAAKARAEGDPPGSAQDGTT